MPLQYKSIQGKNHDECGIDFDRTIDQQSRFIQRLLIFMTSLDLILGIQQAEEIIEGDRKSNCKGSLA
jgi:hypothetical protein